MLNKAQAFWPCQRYIVLYQNNSKFVRLIVNNILTKTFWDPNQILSCVFPDACTSVHVMILHLYSLTKIYMYSRLTVAQ